MATSTNYGWSEPDNTSLVKDGAQAIRTLGDAIDTSLWNVGYGQAGKNKIINGDFFVNQRNFVSGGSSGAYLYDRFAFTATGGTVTPSAQTFTLGSAPVSGYEGKNFLQCIVSGQAAAGDLAWLFQKIESVRTFAGTTATFSFWAKATTGTPKIAIEMAQNFGTGGSPSAAVNTYAGQATISTSWARYSVTVAVPSISGKTIGTNNDDHLRINIMLSAGSDFNARSGSLGVQNNTFQIWGVQLEYGSKATPFQTASGGSPQAELAMCQRYFEAQTDTSGGVDGNVGMGFFVTTTAALTTMYYTPKRKSPSTTLNAGNLEAVAAGPAVLAMSNIIFGTYGGPSTTSQTIVGTVSATTVGLGCQVRTASTAYSIWIDAEL